VDNLISGKACPRANSPYDHYISPGHCRYGMCSIEITDSGALANKESSHGNGIRGCLKGFFRLRAGSKLRLRGSLGFGGWQWRLVLQLVLHLHFERFMLQIGLEEQLPLDISVDPGGVWGDNDVD